MSNIYVFLVIFQYLHSCFDIYGLTIAKEDTIRQKWTLGSTKIDQYNSTNHNGKCIDFQFNYNNLTYNICLQVSHQPPLNLIDPNTTFVNIDYMKLNYTNPKKEIKDLKLLFANGYVKNYEVSSIVEGYIHRDSFYGSIWIGDDEFYAELAKCQNDDDRSTLLSQIQRRDELGDYQRNISNMPSNAEKICSVVIVIDYAFYKDVGHLHEGLAVSIVLQSLSRVNSIFRSTDFDMDGNPDNIGFKVLFISIITSKEEHNKIMMPFTKYPVNGSAFIYKLSTVSDFQKGCIAIVFTTQSFNGNVIGLSYAVPTGSGVTLEYWDGGICSTSAIYNNNVIVISYRHANGYILSQTVCDYALTHELGHSFGAMHDNSSSCKGYLMSDNAGEVNHPGQFSICSKPRMAKVISQRDKCFLKTADAFCGNGILEDKEECDCGSFYNCIYKDHCCFPFTHPHGCRVNRYEGYACHPSQGLCCTEQCMIRNISYLGLDCSKFTPPQCGSVQTSCGFESTCVDGKCHSDNCVRINLLECTCPANSGNYCEICCLHDGNCISALNATKVIFYQNRDLLIAVTERPKKNRSIDFQHRFCDRFNLYCNTLEFYQFPVANYCLSFGTLGTCSPISITCSSTITPGGILPSINNFNDKISAPSIYTLISIQTIILHCFIS